MNKYIKELIKLSTENPNLPIKTFTSYDVACDDTGCYETRIYSVKVEEIIKDGDCVHIGISEFVDNKEGEGYDDKEIKEMYNKAKKEVVIAIFIDFEL